LSVLHNYFDTNDTNLAKFLDISAKLFSHNYFDDTNKIIFRSVSS